MKSPKKCRQTWNPSRDDLLRNANVAFQKMSDNAAVASFAGSLRLIILASLPSSPG